MTTASTSRIWASPVVIAVLMLGSLLTALLGDGIYDALACIVLVGVLGYAIFEVRHGRSAAS